MTALFHPLAPAIVAALRAGGPDAYGQPAGRALSDGGGNPCRACLQDIPKGREMLILAHRPFPAPQPYAETGPIFLCAGCDGAKAGAKMPDIILTRPEFLLKGYTREHRICAGTGRIVKTADVPAYCATLFERSDIGFVDIRSAQNNCFFCRVTARERPLA